jgi:hypothetical protein
MPRLVIERAGDGSPLKLKERRGLASVCPFPSEKHARRREPDRDAGSTPHHAESLPPTSSVWEMLEGAEGDEPLHSVSPE